jgi:predicted O-methyltransferase YrrM
MPNSLLAPEVAQVLATMFARSDENDGTILTRIKQEADAHHGGNRYAPELTGLFDEAVIPVPPDVGQLLYALARLRRPKTIVEIGTSFGVSAIHFAAALKDNGAGRMITAELSAAKVKAAHANLDAAGLSSWVEIRQGDALSVLADTDGIDILFLDGWKDHYVPILKSMEPRLSAGALVIGDDTKLFPDRLAPYLAYTRDPANGYLSLDIPMGDGVELSLRV